MKQLFVLACIICLLYLPPVVQAQTFVTGIDYAPSAVMTTSSTSITAGGATARTFSSTTGLGVNDYITLDVGSSLPMNAMAFGTFWSSDSRLIPSGYKIDYSDDNSSYTNLVTITGNTNLTPIHTFAVIARYWRLTVTALQGLPGVTACNIAGLQLINSGMGAATNSKFWNMAGFGTTAITYMGGNAGIGTRTPSGTLTVASDQVYNQEVGVLALETSNPNKRMYFGYDVNLNAGYIQAQNKGVNAQPILLNAMGGNVGIGTTTPAHKLQVAGSIAANGNDLSGVLNGGFYGGYAGITGYARIIGNSAGASLIDFTKDNQDIDNTPFFNGRINYNFNDNTMSFGVNSAERMRIDGSGNIAIGTTDSKGYKLAVAGNVVAEKLVVKLQANWPDYVFNDSSYQLKPLSQVEQYIKDNKHLPEIPSAAEVTKNGIDVGDNQALLLKKIEELTLYIINQQKQIDALTKEVKDLKK